MGGLRAALRGGGAPTEPLTESETEALRSCVANATGGDSLGFTEHDRAGVSHLATSTMMELRAFGDGSTPPPEDLGTNRDSVPYEAEHEEVEKYANIPVTTGTLSTIMTVEQHGTQLFDAVCQADFEGIVAKRKADPYTAHPVVEDQDSGVHSGGGQT